MNKNKVFFLWVVLLIFNTLDILLTLYGIEMNFIIEGNPIMLYFIENRSLAEVFIFKYLGLMILLILIYFKEISFFSYRLICITVIIFTIITLMHMHWLAIALL